VKGPDIHLFKLEIPPPNDKASIYGITIGSYPGFHLSRPEIDPRQIKLNIEGVDSVRLEIWRGDRRLADLGEYPGGISSKPGPVQMDFGKPGPSGGEAELRVFVKRDILVHKQKIGLILK
jgi:hypothetical protein